MEDANINKPQGALKISAEVIGTIAKLAAKEIDGVVSLGAKTVNFKGILIGKKPTLDSVIVTLMDDVATIDIYVILQYGSNLTAIGEKIQDNVKATVQNMTSVAVNRVNVFVSGVSKDGKVSPQSAASSGFYELARSLAEKKVFKKVGDLFGADSPSDTEEEASGAEDTVSEDSYTNE